MSSLQYNSTENLKKNGCMQTQSSVLLKTNSVTYTTADELQQKWVFVSYIYINMGFEEIVAHCCACIFI